MSVPIYFNESADRLTYILNDSSVRIVVTVGESQARKICECREQMPGLEQVIAALPPVDLHGDVLRYETLIATTVEGDIEEYRRRAAEVTSAQLATIIYTSGTTGEPKGVMLSHSNLTSNTQDGFVELLQTDLGLSFLPLAHVYERVIDYGFLFNGITVAYVEQIDGGGAGTAGSSSDGDGRGAAILRENLREHFGEGASRGWCEACDFRMGAARGGESGSVARVREECACERANAVGDCGLAGVLEDSRGSGRADSSV